MPPNSRCRCSPWPSQMCLRWRCKPCRLDQCDGALRRCPHVVFSFACEYMGVGQHQWYRVGVGAPPILVYFSGDWDVHWGYRALTHSHISEWPGLDFPNDEKQGGVSILGILLYPLYRQHQSRKQGDLFHTPYSHHFPRKASETHIFVFVSFFRCYPGFCLCPAHSFS